MTEAGSVVFVVDGDPSVRRAIKRLVKSVGLQVELFGSAYEFLRSQRPNAPSCLVLDIRLPGTSGLDLQRELLEANIHPRHLHHCPWRHPDDRARHEGGSS